MMLNEEKSDVSDSAELYQVRFIDGACTSLIDYCFFAGAQRENLSFYVHPRPPITYGQWFLELLNSFFCYKFQSKLLKWQLLRLKKSSNTIQ